MADTPRVSLDIVIPVFNEEAVLPQLIERLDAASSPQALQTSGVTHVRYLFVDDGSHDQTAAILTKKISSGWPAVLVRLSRNFGHQAALTAGLDLTNADFVAVIDADLQDPPELIPEMVARLQQGYDVVYGERRFRTENVFKKMAYWGFYRFIRLVSDVSVPIDAGDFCVMRKNVVNALRQLPEKLRFHRGLRSWVGFRQVAFPYQRPGRSAGVSKYTLGALYALATNGIASLSIRPLRITQVILFFSLILTIGLLFVSLSPSALADFRVVRALVRIQVLIVLMSSLQLFSLYVLSAYLGRMYLEVKARPAYIVMETHGRL